MSPLFLQHDDQARIACDKDARVGMPGGEGGSSLCVAVDLKDVFRHPFEQGEFHGDGDYVKCSIWCVSRRQRAHTSGDAMVDNEQIIWVPYRVW